MFLLLLSKLIPAERREEIQYIQYMKNLPTHSLMIECLWPKREIHLNVPILYDIVSVVLLTIKN